MKKVLKYFTFLIFLLAILGAIIYFSSSPIISGIVSENLAKKRIAGIYKVEFKHAYFNIFQMGINITGVELKPDSSQEIKKLYKFQKYIAKVHIKRVELIQLDIIQLINDHKIKIEKIKLIKPSVDLYKNHHYVSSAPKQTVTHDTIGDYKEIHLNDIHIKGLSFTYFIYKDKKADLLIKNINIDLIEPIIDLSQTSSLYDAITIEDLNIELNDIVYKDPKDLYEFSIKNIQYLHQENSINISHLAVKPHLNKNKFAKKHAFQSDRFDATLISISIKDFDVEKYIKKQIIAISSVDISGLDLEVYRDKNYPINKGKHPKLLQQALRASKQKFEIESINLQQSKVVYLEKAPNAKKTGKLELTNMQAQISHLGNTKSWQQKQALKVHLQAKIYKKANLTINLNLPLKSNTFYMSGQLGPMKMNSLNAISISNAGIKIKDGLIKKMDFKASLNSQSSSGSLNLYYQDLEISILKKQKKSGLIKDSKFLNFIANKVYLPTQNPNKRGLFYHGQISFKRDPNKGVLNYLWKSIFSGLKDTVLKGNKHTKENKAEKNKKKERKG
jgi:hypothetical protein